MTNIFIPHSFTLTPSKNISFSPDLWYRKTIW